MKHTITQINNWKIHKLIDIGTSSERWNALDEIVFDQSIINGFGSEDIAVKSLSLCLKTIYEKYPDIVLGVEIGTLNNNQIVKFDDLITQLKS
jgi:hypothetical protein